MHLLDSRARSGQSNIFIAKYDSSGNLLWARAAGGKDYDEAHAIAVDGQGNAYITGYFDSLSATFGSLPLANHSGYDNAFVAKCSSAGVFLWVRQISSRLDSQGNGIALDGLTNVYTTGFFASSTVAFDNFTLTNTGARDIFVAKLGLQSIPTPSLSATLSNHQLVLTWPTAAVGFGLESATNLLSPIWVTNPASPTVVGTNLVLALPASDPSRFFRLRN